MSETPTQYLIREVLIARYRLGEHAWTFPSYLLPQIKKMEGVGWKHGSYHRTLLVWLIHPEELPPYSPPKPLPGPTEGEWEFGNELGGVVAVAHPSSKESSMQRAYQVRASLKLPVVRRWISKWVLDE